jgi:uncharacterized protein
MPADAQRPSDIYQTIEGYGPGRFRVSGHTHQGSVIVFPERTIAWEVRAFDQVSTASLAPAIDAGETIEILLLGCGERMGRVGEELRAALRQTGVVLEPMATGAAARTFNLLLSEDRRVAAALIALPA